MAKIFAPGFPSRRPGGFVRYIIVAAIVLLLLYKFMQSDEAPYNPSIDPAFRAPSGTRPVGGSGNNDNKPLYESPSIKETLPDKETISQVVPEMGHETDDKSNKDTKKPSKPSKPFAYDEEEEAYEQAASSHKTAGYGKDKDQDKDKLKDSSSEGSSSKTDASKSTSSTSGDSTTSGPEGMHPIDTLIYNAQHNFAGLLASETKTLTEAAQAYRKRRGRHPPPGFDKWFEFARNHSAVIVEDFFDQIYHDLEPYWGMNPAVIRKESWDFEMVINVRNGVATAGSDWFWTQIWLNMIKTVEHLLPDMDIALNAMDEPRLVVPWEDINGFMTKAAKTVKLGKATAMKSEWQKLPPPGQGDLDIVTRPKDWEDTKPYWQVARRGCDPNSAARTAPMQQSFSNPPIIDMDNAKEHSYRGYVSNFTKSTEICHQADLQGLEGILIRPLSCSATKTLFPMFGGSKLQTNNEILLPAPMYWNEEERFTGGDDHGIAWKDKHDGVVWRGVATGGKNTEENWRGFQRHRFVSMTNGTKISMIEEGKGKAENFAMPEEQYEISSQKEKKMGEWVDSWSDVSFVDLNCEPPQPDGSCPYTDSHFSRALGLKMSEQFDYKYLPDIDGNSFSGRYLGFLRSTSLVVKATLWREWHDSRLVPWKHFVPMDSRFGDFAGIMEYFLGYNGKNAHDAAAEKIASEGKEWAEAVLRKEDMQIYVLRLLMEYGRLLDDDRVTLGWVDDVLTDPSLSKIWDSWW